MKIKGKGTKHNSWQMVKKNDKEKWQKKNDKD